MEKNSNKTTEPLIFVTGNKNKLLEFQSYRTFRRFALQLKTPQRFIPYFTSRIK